MTATFRATLPPALAHKVADVERVEELRVICKVARKFD